MDVFLLWVLYIVRLRYLRRAHHSWVWSRNLVNEEALCHWGAVAPITKKIDVISTVNHNIELFHQPTLMHSFLYSLAICLLHYYPPHVSSINMTIFRRKNCIHTASGIFALCKRLHSTLVESGLSPLSTSVLCRRLEKAKIPDAVWIQFFLLKMVMLILETCRG